MKRTFIGGLIVAASLIPMGGAFAYNGGAGQSIASTDGDTGGTVDRGGERAAGPGPGRTEKERTPSPAPNPSSSPTQGGGSASNITWSGETIAYSAPAPPARENPTPTPPPTPKDQPKAATTKAAPATSAPSAPESTSSSSTGVTRRDPGPVDGRERGMRPGRHPVDGSAIFPPIAPATPGDAPSRQTYEEALKAAQQAAVAVKLRHKMRTPRPRIKVAKPERSNNVTNWDDVADLLFEAVLRPNNLLTRAKVMIKAVAPARGGTSSATMWVDGPSAEELVLMERIMAVEDARPADARRDQLYRFIDDRIWEATHEPYIAAPRPH